MGKLKDTFGFFLTEFSKDLFPKDDCFQARFHLINVWLLVAVLPNSHVYHLSIDFPQVFYVFHLETTAHRIRVTNCEIPMSVPGCKEHW